VQPEYPIMIGALVSSIARTSPMLISFVIIVHLLLFQYDWILNEVI
jgi:hypothetical protein